MGFYSMKKIMPVFLTLIMIICSFSACEKKTNPLDKFDSINANTTIDELKAIFEGCEIKDETETSFTVIDDNSVLQPLAEKYKDDIPEKYRPIEVDVESTSSKIDLTLNKVYIRIGHDFHKLNEQDKDELLKQFTDKYGEFELTELKKGVDGYKYYYRWISSDKKTKIELNIYINTGVSIRYFYDTREYIL